MVEPSAASRPSRTQLRRPGSWLTRLISILPFSTYTKNLFKKCFITWWFIIPPFIVFSLAGARGRCWVNKLGCCAAWDLTWLEGGGLETREAAREGGPQGDRPCGGVQCGDLAGTALWFGSHFSLPAQFITTVKRSVASGTLPSVTLCDGLWLTEGPAFVSRCLLTSRF